MNTFDYTRRDFLKAIGLSGAALAMSRVLFAGRASKDRPNIILILADDVGYGDVGCYGNETITTPNIDALAKGGVRFTDFHSNSPVCSPTRAALLTGHYQQRCGIEGVILARGSRDKGMAPEEITFAEVLKTAGYTTAILGKWHLGYQVKFNPANQGFDVFRGYVSGNVDYHSHIDPAGYEDWWHNTQKIAETGYTTDLITDHAVRFIEQHKDEPFCLYLPHEAAHSPYQGRSDPSCRGPNAVLNNLYDRKGRKDRAGAYKEMIEVMDEGIGRIVKTVKRLGLEHKTFIFFCSDNGGKLAQSNRPLRGSKRSLWEGGHRVPAIAYWPGRTKPGTVTDETTIGMDLFATIIAIAGASLPVGLKLDGVNLLPMLLEGKKLPSRTLFWRFEEQKAVRKGPWKLLVRKNGQTLYNLADDLGEKKDLAVADPERVKQLQAELSAWEEEVSADARRKAERASAEPMEV